MQSIRTIQVAALLAASSCAFAHEKGGWASIHWHTSDFLGLAAVGVLCAGALLVAHRQKKLAAKKSKQ